MVLRIAARQHSSTGQIDSFPPLLLHGMRVNRVPQEPVDEREPALARLSEASIDQRFGKPANGFQAGHLPRL